MFQMLCHRKIGKKIGKCTVTAKIHSDYQHGQFAPYVKQHLSIIHEHMSCYGPQNNFLPSSSKSK